MILGSATDMYPGHDPNQLLHAADAERMCTTRLFEHVRFMCDVADVLVNLCLREL